MNDTDRLADKALLDLTNLTEAFDGEVTPRGSSVDDVS